MNSEDEIKRRIEAEGWELIYHSCELGIYKGVVKAENEIYYYAFKGFHPSIYENIISKVKCEIRNKKN